MKIDESVNDNVKSALCDAGFNCGRMISGSKSHYLSIYPNNEVYFNANIVVEGYGKCWFGDLDITRDRKTLQKIANKHRINLWILREHDCRFGREQRPDTELKKDAVCIIKSEV